MMMREEAIEELERLLSHWDELENGKRSLRWYSKASLEVALTALRPVSREQVEKVWRGEWEHPGYYDDGGSFVHDCSKCNTPSTDEYWFCPHCGAPMTDEAVEITMKRLEALKDGKGD